MLVTSLVVQHLVSLFILSSCMNQESDTTEDVFLILALILLILTLILVLLQQKVLSSLVGLALAVKARKF